MQCACSCCASCCMCVSRLGLVSLLVGMLQSLQHAASTVLDRWGMSRCKDQASDFFSEHWPPEQEMSHSDGHGPPGAASAGPCQLLRLSVMPYSCRLPLALQSECQQAGVGQPSDSHVAAPAAGCRHSASSAPAARSVGRLSLHALRLCHHAAVDALLQLSQTLVPICMRAASAAAALQQLCAGWHDQQDDAQQCLDRASWPGIAVDHVVGSSCLHCR